MKSLFCAWLLAPALLLAGLLHSVPAPAQQLVICNLSTNASCNPNTNPGNGAQGMPAWTAFGVINVDLSLIPSALFNGLPLPIINGGTGQTTASGAINALLPPQGAFAGNCLGTNGSSASWIACGTGGGGGGGVSSVGLTMPSQFSIAGSNPITGAGSFVVTLSGTAFPVSSGGTGASSLTGPLKGNGSSAFSVASIADILALGTGCTSSTVWLNGAGGCTAPSGSGTVNTGSTGSLAYYASTGTSISPASLGGNLAFLGSVLQTSQKINPQTGTSYAFLSTDAGKLVTFSNSSATAVTLSQAGTTGFTSGYSIDVENLGAGTVTISPTTSTVNGASTLSVAQNTGCTVTSDGTNYQVSACTALGNSGQAEATLAYSTGFLGSLSGAPIAGYTKVVKASTADNFTASALTFTCSGNPVVTMYECGTSATCASPTTMGTATVTSQGTAVNASISSSAIGAGHYVGWGVTGTCSGISLYGNAQIHSN